MVHDDEQNRIVGYHALTAAVVTHDEALPRAAKGMRRHPIPAIDTRAHAFYERHGFEPSPTDAMNLQMLIKDLRAAVDERGSS